MENKSEVFEEFAELLGADTANKFIDYFAGTNLYIPKNLITAQRNQEIKKAFQSGASYRELARRYGYTERNIRYIIHGRKKIKSS